MEERLSSSHTWLSVLSVPVAVAGLGHCGPDRDVISFGREILPLSIYGVGTIHLGAERRGTHASQHARRSRWGPKTRKLASGTVERKICRAT